MVPLLQVAAERSTMLDRLLDDDVLSFSGHGAFNPWSLSPSVVADI